MSQPRRRRRRKRGAPRPPEGQSKKQKRSQPQRDRAPEASSSRRRRRRGRGGQGRGGQTRKSPASSEDLVRAPKKPRPETLTGPHDGTTLEQVIGDLQSEWGVPQHPQEYRLVFKVPEEKEGGRAPGLTATEEVVDPPDEQTDADKPRREKAPAAPRITGSGNDKTPQATTSRKKRGRRRRKRSKGGGGN
jgi:hypothetical protein